MKLSELNTSQLCSQLHRAESATISFSWFGDPQVSVKNGDEVSSDSLSNLIHKTNRAIQSNYPGSSLTPEQKIEIGYLTNRVSELEELSCEEIKKANFITLFFYRMGEFFERLSNLVSYNPPSDFDFYRSCYLSMPLNTPGLANFMLRFPPNRLDSSNNEPLYNSTSVSDIYRRLNPIASGTTA